MKRRDRNASKGKEKTAAAPSGQRQFLMEPQCLEDLRYWTQADPRLANRTLRIMSDALRDPFEGIGKPEPLRRESRERGPGGSRTSIGLRTASQRPR